MTKKDKFEITYWDDKKARMDKTTVSMDETLVDSFVRALRIRISEAGVAF